VGSGWDKAEAGVRCGWGVGRSECLAEAEVGFGCGLGVWVWCTGNEIGVWSVPVGVWYPIPWEWQTLGVAD